MYRDTVYSQSKTGGCIINAINSSTSYLLNFAAGESAVSSYMAGLTTKRQQPTEGGRANDPQVRTSAYLHNWPTRCVPPPSRSVLRPSSLLLSPGYSQSSSPSFRRLRKYAFSYNQNIVNYRSGYPKRISTYSSYNTGPRGTK